MHRTKKQYQMVERSRGHRHLRKFESRTHLRRKEGHKRTAWIKKEVEEELTDQP